MKLFSGVVLCLAIFAEASFAASFTGFFRDPKYPGKCAIRADLILSPGDTIKDPDQACGQISCVEHSLALFNSCNFQEIKGCKLGGYIDKSLPYPDCCKRNVICD